MQRFGCARPTATLRNGGALPVHALAPIYQTESSLGWWFWSSIGRIYVRKCTLWWYIRIFSKPLVGYMQVLCLSAHICALWCGFHGPLGQFGSGEFKRARSGEAAAPKCPSPKSSPWKETLKGLEMRQTYLRLGNISLWLILGTQLIS